MLLIFISWRCLNSNSIRLSPKIQHEIKPRNPSKNLFHIPESFKILKRSDENWANGVFSWTWTTDQTPIRNFQVLRNFWFSGCINPPYKAEPVKTRNSRPSKCEIIIESVQPVCSNHDFDDCTQQDSLNSCFKWDTLKSINWKVSRISPTTFWLEELGCDNNLKYYRKRSGVYSWIASL